MPCGECGCFVGGYVPLCDECFEKGNKMTIELIDMDTGDTMEVHGDKVSGLQFSGKPTERAECAKLAIRDLNRYRTGVFGNSENQGDIAIDYLYDYEFVLIEALELMAQEKEQV